MSLYVLIIWAPTLGSLGHLPQGTWGVAKADSGIKIDAKASIAWMLSSYVDQDFGNVEDITSGGDCALILPYLEKGANKEMKENCVKVLEACLQYDVKLKSREGLTQALKKYKSSSRRPSAQL